MNLTFQRHGPQSPKAPQHTVRMRPLATQPRWPVQQDKVGLGKQSRAKQSKAKQSKAKQSSPTPTAGRAGGTWRSGTFWWTAPPAARASSTLASSSSTPQGMVDAQLIGAYRSYPFIAAGQGPTFTFPPSNPPPQNRPKNTPKPPKTATFKGPPSPRGRAPTSTSQRWSPTSRPASGTTPSTSHRWVRFSSRGRALAGAFGG